MFTSFDIEIIKKFLANSENIQALENKFEYIEAVKKEDKFKIIDKNKILYAKTLILQSLRLVRNF